MINLAIPEVEIWIKKFQSGNQIAFKEVFDLCGSNLFFFVKGIIKDKKEASSIVTASFIQLWKERERFSDLNEIKSYLHQITRNACEEYLKNADHTILLHKELGYPKNGMHEDALNRIVYGDILKIIFDEIENLPEPARMVFKMTYVEGLTTAEIATQSGMTRQHIGKNKKRALELLRSSLAEQNFLLSLSLLELICYAKMNHII